MSIILIGMPSCGKSTLGVLLAKKLGYRFVDSDLLIQESEGMLLHEIIEKRGAEGFLQIEDRINSQIEEQNAIIATGGSVVYCRGAMEHLKTLGKVVYLKIPFEEMERRLGDFAHRGVIMRHGNKLSQMYEERAPLYERYADVTVDVFRASLADSLQRICEAMKDE
ncbi:MAG: shikimate kinase [Ruminococcaceae bacterium]|nr:shikimate kinase [Oscillospiraceae bacterium]